MILTPVYCSSEPPPASGPVRSKITPILIFFSWAPAGTAMPSPIITANSLPNRWAALRTNIKPSRDDCALTVLFLLAPITLIAPTDVKRVGEAPRADRRARGPVRVSVKTMSPLPLENGYGGALGHVAF